MGAAIDIVNERVHAATRRAVESCTRVERVADGMIEEMEDVTPIHGIPLTDLDDEDSAVIAITEVLDHKTIEPKVVAGPGFKRLRTEPGTGIR